MKKDDKKHLYYLEELSDYKVDSHYSDVSGWPVKDREDRVIGKVSNLLVNKNLEKVVYLDVEVDDSIIDANHDPYASPANAGLREFVNKKGENHIIIPIGMVDIDDEQKFVYTDSIGYQTFAETKRMTPGANINRDYEMMVLNSYNRDRSTRYDEDFDRNPEYKKESPYLADRKKEGDAGHEEVIDEIEKSREALAAERKNLEMERRKLEAERIALKQERKKLEAERKRHILDKNDTGNIGTEYEETSEFQNKENLYPDDDSFYKRKEFDRSKDSD
ncbi:MAG: PRC-barrel domain-containing protein [Flavobacteriaceae bacterium]|nr:PRC-barrel domain-containing protein [Flavobacteriaceae bacterium]